MVGTTLVDIREHVEALAAEDGDYHVVCARTGTRPVPADGKRFPDRERARAAARATEQYRAALRRYDPRVPYHDVIACEVTNERTEGPTHLACSSEADWSISPPVRTRRTADPDAGRRIAFCHDVAAAVFEALSAGGHDRVERAVMDAYFDLAERLGDPDDLCLCLLESMAAELDERLDHRTQAVVLSDAAARLGSVEDDRPITATLQECQGLGLLGEYSNDAWGVENGRRTVVFDLTDYALSPADGHLPVLPLVVGFLRRSVDGPLTDVVVTEMGDGWRVRIVADGVERPTGLARASIEEAI